MGGKERNPTWPLVLPPSCQCAPSGEINIMHAWMCASIRQDSYMYMHIIMVYCRWIKPHGYIIGHMACEVFIGVGEGT